MNRGRTHSPTPSAHPLDSVFRAHAGKIATALIALLTLFAWTNRFIQDDAFISFRYALHLAEGHGLVWNIGEPIEGYTNFLWVLVIASGITLGIDPVPFSQGIGLLLFAGTLLFTYLLIREIIGSAVIAVVAVAFLGTNYTFSAYATGGLETQLQALLCTGVAYLTCRALRRNIWSRRELLAISLTMAAALLTRLDSGLLCAVAGLWCLASWYRTAPEAIAKRLTMLALPLVLIVGAWLSWKLWYYGEILPNTFRLKGSFTSYERGAWYIHRFATSYLLYPALIFALASAQRFIRSAPRELRMLGVMSAAWIAYVASVGGDFMEFRFLVPALSLLTPVAAWLLSASHKGIRIALMLLFAYGSLRHATTFRYDSFYEIESTRMLEGHLNDPKEQWVNIGKRLGEAFGHDPEIRIAATPAGAIPFYSRLTTIDMLGLSDRFVADSGIVLGTRPGHERIAPLSYLRRRQVHLAVSHPTIVPIGSPTFVAPFLPREKGEPVPDVPLIEIPLDAQYKLIVWYLLPHPKIDEAIRRYHWNITRVEADQETQ